LYFYFIQTELYDDVLDGRVFRASDIVTFPPEGEGITNAFTSAGSFHFSGEYGVVTSITQFFPIVIETFCRSHKTVITTCEAYISTYSEGKVIMKLSLSLNN
jgi:hypothetical protein